MTMGLILLGIITISLFFPFGRRAFGGMRITAPWAFLIVACFAVGVIVPVITIGSTFTMSLSGFLFPALIMLALVPALIIKRGAARALVAELAVTAVVTLFSVVVPVTAMGWQTLWAIACGISVGALAFLVARTPLHAVYAASGGIVLGNIAYGFINFYAYGAPVFSLGQSWIYNAFFIAIAVVLSACELSVALSHAAANASATRRSLRFEAGEDRNFDDEAGEDEIFR